MGRRRGQLMPSLFVIHGRDQGKRFELRGPSVRIGREKGNGVQLHDTEVSRFHAEIRWEDDQYILQDLGSSNGTYVNSQLVPRHTLGSGDRVQLGRTLMIFTAGDDPSSAGIVDGVDIVPQNALTGGSRIVSSLGPQPGSQILGPESASESPWLARARSNLDVMYHTALAASHTLDIDQLLQRIVDLIFEWVEADRGCVMLLDRETESLLPKVRRNRKATVASEKMEISRTILDYVMQHREGVLTSDASEDDRWDSAASILKMGVREAICVPMQGRYDVVGVIYIDTFTPPGRFIHRPSNRFSRRTPETDGRDRTPGRPGRGRYVVLFGHGPSRTIGRDRTDHRHPLPSHQEYPARHSRRQLPDRRGTQRQRIRTRRQRLEHCRQEPGEDLEPGHGHAVVQQGTRTGNGLGRHSIRRGGCRGADAVTCRRRARRAGVSAGRLPAPLHLRPRCHASRHSERRHQRH